MQAMLLTAPGTDLVLTDMPTPQAGAGEVLVRVLACGVCRTDLHILDGELSQAHYPVIPGHQIVGEIVATGDGVPPEVVGRRVGIPWLGGTCGQCRYCLGAQENLCPDACFTGCQRNGGFAEYCTADLRFCLAVPDHYADLQLAPLLCAGLIGYRALAMTGTATHLGFMGFGASAHILAQLCRAQGKSVYAFTRPGDSVAQDFARQLGAVWAGACDETPPQALDAVIIFAPDGALVPAALALVRPGGRVVCAGIHMSTIPAFSYDLLWEERTLMSVANLTRLDGQEFMRLAGDCELRTHVTPYALSDANRALEDLRQGRFSGAAVLAIAT